MAAPELTDAQAEQLARIEAAPVCAESWEARVETAARAIFAADDFPGPAWEDDVEGNREDYRRLAAAALDPTEGRR